MSITKTLLDDWTPPIVRRAIRNTSQAIRRGVPKRSRTNGNGECDAQWYDASFAKNRGYQVHYTESRYYALWSVVAAALMPLEGKAVLDIGCGPGHFARLLWDLGVRDYCGFDFSPARVEFAMRQSPDMEFHVDDVYATRLFDEASYDCAVCTEVLEHLEGDQSVIERLRSGTMLVASVPSYDSESHVRFYRSEDEVRK